MSDRQADDIARTLGGHAVGVFSEAPMHTPVDVTERALEIVRATNADGVVAIGGGTGLSSLLRGLKTYTSNLSAIVTVADDG